MIDEAQLKMNKLNKIFGLLMKLDAKTDKEVRKFLLDEFDDVATDLIVMLNTNGQNDLQDFETGNF